jgi:hypothetical protein
MQVEYKSSPVQNIYSWTFQNYVRFSYEITQTGEKIIRGCICVCVIYLVSLM